jgi:hypothetical protein
MAGMLKKPLWGGKKEKKPEKTMDQMILEARMKLESARTRNLNVIEAERRNIQYNRKHGGSQSLETKHIMKIKSAYYSLGIIDHSKERLNDIESTQELYKAMNEITYAIRLVNQVFQKSTRPDINQFVKADKKLDKAIQKDDGDVANMYRSIGDINELVSDDVVEKIILGESAEKCIRLEEGIKVSMSDLPQISLEEVKGGSAAENQPLPSLDDIDFSKLDISDL